MVNDSSKKKTADQKGSLEAERKMMQKSRKTRRSTMLIVQDDHDGDNAEPSEQLEQLEEQDFFASDDEESSYQLSQFEKDFEDDSAELYKQVMSFIVRNRDLKSEVQSYIQEISALTDDRNDTATKSNDMLESYNALSSKLADTGTNLTNTRAKLKEVSDLLKQNEQKFGDRETNLCRTIADKDRKHAERESVLKKNCDMETAKLRTWALDIRNLKDEKRLLEESLGSANAKVSTLDACTEKIKQLEKLLELARKHNPNPLSPLPSIEDEQPARGRITTTGRTPRQASSRSDSQSPSRRENTQETDISRLTAILERNQGQNRGKEPHIPDPERLTDGKSPSYRTWSKSVVAIFSVKTQSLGTPNARMAYLYSLTAGAAQRRLAPRFLSGGPDEYQDYGPMLDDLVAALEDPNAKVTAKNKYIKLKQRNDELFITFEQEFYELAIESGTNQTEWRDDLLRKIKHKLLSETYTSQDSYMDYDSLKDHLNKIDRRMRAAEIENVQQQKETFKAAAAAPVKKFVPYLPGSFGYGKPQAQEYPKDKPKVSFAGAYSNTLAARSARPPTLPSAMKLLTPAPKNNGDCYNCRKPGHIARECPQLRSTIAELALTGEQVIDFLHEADLAELQSAEAERGEEESDEDVDEIRSENERA